MEKDKSRGIKHIKDKQKYKGNSTKNPKYVPPKISPKNLGSNWDRYDSDEEYDDDEENTNRGDFQILANAPISTGSHFQFKADQAKEIEEIKYNSSNIFNLNLEALHQSIMGISFYERLGIDKEYFTPEEIKIMDKEAKQHLKEKIKISGEEDRPSNKAPNYILGRFVDYGNPSASKRDEELTDSEDDDGTEEDEHDENGENEDEDEGVAVEDDLETWLDQVLDE